MAVLDSTARAAIWAEFMREESSDRNSITITKAELRAAFDAADDWAEANAAAFNTALPQPARGSLSARQKAKLLAAVLAKRYGVTV